MRTPGFCSDERVWRDTRRRWSAVVLLRAQVRAQSEAGALTVEAPLFYCERRTTSRKRLWVAERARRARRGLTVSAFDSQAAMTFSHLITSFQPKDAVIERN